MSDGAKAKAGKTKKAPPVAVINRAPAGVHEARIKAEQAMKEDRCREVFEANSLLYKKSRNPCIGELSPRDNADFLIPIEQTIKKLAEKAAYDDYTQTTELALTDATKTMHSFQSRAIKKSELDRLESLRRKRMLIDHELKQLEQIRDLKGLQIYNRPF